MIAYLKGKIIHKELGKIILDIGGIGYEIFLSLNSYKELPDEGETVAIHTSVYLRDDLIQLFGFKQIEEKELYQRLVSVTGIGPKVALAVLSYFDVSSFQDAILGEDVERICMVPGVGRKTAQRLILELGDKIVDIRAKEREISKSSIIYSEVKGALLNLGYSSYEAKKILEPYKFDEQRQPEEVLKEILQNLAQK